MKLSRAIFAIATTITMSFPLIAVADNVLVFGTYSSKDILASSLSSLGHTVTNQTDMPADISGFDSVWHVDAFNPLTAAQQTQLSNYLAAGGGVHLTGERPCCEALNDSLQQFLNSILVTGGIQVGDLGDINGPYVMNSSALLGLATTPNAVSTWVPNASGGMGGLGNLPDPNILATGAGDVPVGGAWADGDFISAAGRLTLFMDTNWFESPGNGDNLAIIENIQHFLTSGEVNVDVGTARFIVTKIFEDGITEGVDVTLTCNAGLPLTQSFTIAGGDPNGVTFVVTELTAAGADCTVTESGSPAGYTPVLNGGDVCTFENVTSGVRSCEIVNLATDASYTVNMEWEVPENSTVLTEDVLVTISCDKEITTSGAYQDGAYWLLESDLGDGDSLSAIVDMSTGAALCSADFEEQASGIESINGCSEVSVSVGDTDECTITLTAFFEGIPTLSAMGLAILALMMLSIGLVGFRRMI